MAGPAVRKNRFLRRAVDAPRSGINPAKRMLRGDTLFSPGFPFFMNRLRMWREDWQSPLTRTRDFWKLVWVVSGRARHFINGEMVHLEGGDLLVVGPRDAISYRVDSEDLQIVNVCFDPALLIPPHPGDPGPLDAVGREGRARVHHVATAPDGLLRIFEELEAEMERKSAGYRSMVRLKVGELLVKIGRIKPTRGTAQGRVLRLLDEVLDGKYMEPVHLPSLAKLAGMHPGSLGRLFRRHRGVSFTAALEARRIEKACELLVSNAMPVAGIATEVGFPDLSFFYRVFRRVHGMPPGAWKERALKRNKGGYRDLPV